jgi:hypothetical protein
MKGTFFTKPLEWNVETNGESWPQGSELKGTLRVRNHGAEKVTILTSGVGFALADIKKVHTRTQGALKPQSTVDLSGELLPGKELSIDFNFKIGPNAAVTDKKSSWYLTYGQNFIEGQLQVKVEPNPLYLKIMGLLDTFYRFKLKDFKATKMGVEFKLLPPTSREMSNIESLCLTFGMEGELLRMKFDFQVKKLDTSSITNKISKDSVVKQLELTPKEYLLGKDIIHQDQILKNLESVLSNVKIQNIFLIQNKE